MTLSIRKAFWLWGFLSASLILALAVAPRLSAAPGDIRYQREDDVGGASFPPAVFPHWVHRIRYRCDACHDAIFEMTPGSQAITMEMIAQGEACGVCHDGERAFGDDMQSCGRCHTKASE